MNSSRVMYRAPLPVGTELLEETCAFGGEFGTLNPHAWPELGTRAAVVAASGGRGVFVAPVGQYDGDNTVR